MPRYTYLIRLYLCSKVVKDSAANELNLENVGGVFLVLLVGLLSACVMACLERCLHSKIVGKRKMAQVREAEDVFPHFVGEA